jgi:hypothetical protein
MENEIFFLYFTLIIEQNKDLLNFLKNLILILILKKMTF